MYSLDEESNIKIEKECGVMVTYNEISELINQVETYPLTLLYISQSQCSVCHSVHPKIEKLLYNYPKVNYIAIDIAELPELAGYFTVFTAPVIIFLNHSKELYRQARFIQMEELSFQLNKYVTHLLPN